MAAVNVRCYTCKTIYKIEAPVEAWKKWAAGDMIQHSLYMVSKEDRELLLSNICGNCFEGRYE